MKTGPRIASFVSQPWFGLRVFLGFGIASAFMGGMKGLFAELAKTQDWVLEYRDWISYGALVIAFVLWLGFVLVTHPNKSKTKSGTTPN
jgi:hypothetical protein